MTIKINFMNLLNLHIYLTGNLTKSASESSLSDGGETTSAKETARRHDEKDTCSDNDEHYERKEEVDSCEETKEEEYDNEKDLEDEKDNITHRSKLQKQGNVVLRRKSKANPLYRKSKFYYNFG